MCTINKVHIFLKKGAFHGFIDTMEYKTQMNTCWQYGIKGKWNVNQWRTAQKGKIHWVFKFH